MRYFGPNKWSLAFYAYSNEHYEPCLFPKGNWFGTLEEAKKINYLRYNHPNLKIQKRFEVLWLKRLKYSHKEIAIIADVHPDTVTDYLKAYSNGGIEQIQSFSYRKQKSELAFYSDAIKESFNDKLPQTLREACARIEQLTAIKRKKSQVHHFMQKMGFKKIKAAQIPAKADPKKQRDTAKRSGVVKALFFYKPINYVWAFYLGNPILYNALLYEHQKNRQ